MMAVYETFSKHQKRLAKAGQTDVYQYDELSVKFRGQVRHIWDTAIGSYYASGGYSDEPDSPSNQFWAGIHDTLAREGGVLTLGSGTGHAKSICETYLMSAPTSDALDIIQLSFQVIDNLTRQMKEYDRNEAGITQDPDDAIEELNERFREHSLGYQYLGGKLVRVDSQFAHEEIVKPALALLNGGGFDGPADEFIAAFEHYKNGRNKAAVAEALKAFESTMKAVTARNWTYSSTATAKDLIRIVLDNGLISPELESHFSSFRSMMQSGLPTVRNRTSGHGQGPTPVEVPPHVVAYALHLAASNIIFIVEAHKALK
jgi:hypothetical protein